MPEAGTWQRERERVVAYLRAKARKLRDDPRYGERGSMDHEQLGEAGVLEDAANEIEKGEHSAVDLGPLKASTKGTPRMG